MPVTIATERGVRTAGLRQTPYVFLRFRIVDFLLAVWAITVLSIAAYVSLVGAVAISGRL